MNTQIHRSTVTPHPGRILQPLLILNSRPPRRQISSLNFIVQLPLVTNPMMAISHSKGIFPAGQKTALISN